MKSQKIIDQMTQKIWAQYSLAELTDRNGTDYTNLNFALKTIGLSLPTEKDKLLKLIDSFILNRWINLKLATNPDAKDAVGVSQHEFSQLRISKPEFHSKWKILRDARSKYSTNIWRKIDSIPDRLDRVFGSGSLRKELNLNRIKQKLRMVSHDMDQAGNIELSRAIDELVSQNYPSELRCVQQL